MLKYLNSDKILTQKEEFDTLFLNTSFSVDDLSDISPIDKNSERLKSTFELIENSYNSLKVGGLMFIYGAPKYLSFYADYLNNLEKEDATFLFKYWIGIKFQDMFLSQPLPNSHIGLLMYLKTKKTKNPTPFKLNTKEYRIPYSNCKACGDNLKDWGGKKHLMNPLGTSFSDVWTDLSLNKKELNRPERIIDRVYNLTVTNGENLLVINEKKIKNNSDSITLTKANNEVSKFDLQSFEYLNKVVKMDCVEFMSKIKKQYPQGIYDLAFADPPYNLEKNYLKYDDDKEELEYIDWCNKWLDGMYDILKPGGSLLVLNIPKWAIEHYVNLAPKMNFRNWIIWDALSTPSGKLLPAHYSLIHFTKPSTTDINKVKTNKINIDSREYCLRGRCIKQRKLIGEDKKEYLTDIWRDVHRIKHKKDRDFHPCQLPTKLMNRIIEIYSEEGDLVFDPFGGAGTTAISAKLNNRNYTITDIDDEYFDIAHNNLDKITETRQGEFVFERLSVKRPKESKVSQKQIEKKYLELCFKYNSAIDIEKIRGLDENLYNNINNYYPRENKYLVKIANRQLENIDILNQKDL
jgi:DNA modification methylase